jgi:hypothetical protein
MPRSPKGERRLAGGVGTAIMQAKMKFKDDRPFATARKFRSRLRQNSERCEQN